MTAKEYLTEKARMTECRLNPECETCGLSKKNNSMNIGCVDLETDHPDKAIAIVEEWSKAHPRKTYKDDFLEKFPNSSMSSGVIPIFCRKDVYGSPKFCHSEVVDCFKCWNEPMEETK